MKSWAVNVCVATEIVIIVLINGYADLLNDSLFLTPRDLIYNIVKREALLNKQNAFYMG